MVSQITTGYPTDEQGHPYRRRRYRPALVAVVVLAVLALIVWIVALVGGEDNTVPTSCNQPSPATATSGASTAPGAAPTPAAKPPTLTAESRDEMLGVAPAALSTFQVRVLNASSQRGEARSVSDDLTAQGFNPTPENPYTDDTVYPNKDLECVAQIRFGPAGKGSAAAVWLAIPCAQLVNDGRSGTNVDVALGQYYQAHEQSQDAQAALEALRSADPKNPKSGVDPALVRAAHSASC